MHRRIVTATVVVLFLLLAYVSWVMTDFFDRSYPQALGVKGALSLDFSRSTLDRSEGFARLEQLDKAGGLGLYRLVPDLGKTDTQVFVDLSEESAAGTVDWFGDYPPARVEGVQRLENSEVDGTYFVTDVTGLGPAIAGLKAAGVEVTWRHDSPFRTVLMLGTESGLVAPVLAIGALVCALVVYWLAARSRSRALRVLHGASPWRIQLQDLGGLLARLAGGALMASVAATGIVAVSRGWTYVPVFASVLVPLTGGVLLACVAAAVILSCASWPSVALLADRRPAVQALRWPARVVQGVALLALLGLVGPAWLSMQQAGHKARELEAWNQLADEVVISFAIGEADMDKLGGPIGQVVADAEADGQAALSYTLTHESWGGDFSEYSAIAFVNREWLERMEGPLGPDALRPVSADTVAPMLTRELGPSIELWHGPGTKTRAVIGGLTPSRPAPGIHYPVIAGGTGGQLDFLGDVLVLQLPRIADMFNQWNVVSLASSGNIIFTGAQATQDRLDAAGLDHAGLKNLGITGSLRPVYVAEQGILLAQYSRYISQLLTMSVLAIGVAFVLASAITAMIGASLAAHRDFPMRLNGATWPAVTRRRSLSAVGLVAVLSLVVAIFQPPAALPATLLAALVALGATYVAQPAAAATLFTRVTRRKT